MEVDPASPEAVAAAEWARRLTAARFHRDQETFEACVLEVFDLTPEEVSLRLLAVSAITAVLVVELTRIGRENGGTDVPSDVFARVCARMEAEGITV